MSRETQAAPFGMRLRRLREAAGLTQDELARLAGLTARGISDLERGVRKRPYPHTVRSIAGALGLSEGERASLLAAVPKRAVAPAPGQVSDLLPAPPTPLVGRERELQEVADFLGRPETRLLTLVGTGGIGKTRLAIQAARDAGDLFPDGAVFVGLAPLGDGALVFPSVAKSLGLREAAGHAARDVLREHIRGKRLLLVLDNFEHLMGAAPEVVGLIEACPNLVVLCTSRSPLRVRGEQEYPVPPLTLPSPARAPTPDEVADSSSGRLFLDRARSASPAFGLTTANAAAVASICRRLDGLPLALELAAARMRFLDPHALLSRLDRVLEAGGGRDLPQRQRTMRATLDWSHGLLSRAAKDLFARLSVFSGGFMLGAAEAVGEDEASGGELDVLALLGSLVEHSLVLAEPDARGARVRYRMLEPVRQYALEKLEEGGLAEEMRLRHAKNYLTLVEEAGPRLRGREQVEWLDLLEAENANLRAAVGWTLEDGDAEMALRLVAGLWWFWYKRGYMVEGRRWLEVALAKSHSPTPARAEVLNGAGVLARLQADYEQAQAWLEESLSLKREIGDKKGVADVLINLGTVALDRGDYSRSADLVSESLSLRRELGDALDVAGALNNLGVTARAQGDLAAAASLGEESLRLFRAHEDSSGIAMVLSNLGEVAEERGEYSKASACYQESLSLYREVGEKRGIALLTNRLGRISRVLDDHERAATLYGESLRLNGELGDRLGISQNLEGVATVLVARGRPEAAVRLWAAAEALRETIDAPPRAVERARYEPFVATARETLGEGAFEVVWAEARTMTFEEAVAYAFGGEGAP